MLQSFIEAKYPYSHGNVANIEKLLAYNYLWLFVFRMIIYRYSEICFQERNNNILN